MLGIIVVMEILHNQQQQIELKLYVNGVQETSFATSTYPSQNYDGFINNTVPTFIYNGSANLCFLMAI